MSVCYHINCHDCEERLWIAQGSSPTIYTGDEKVMKGLGEFLYKHEGHRLSFDDDDKCDWYKDFVSEDLGEKNDRS